MKQTPHVVATTTTPDTTPRTTIQRGQKTVPQTLEDPGADVDPTEGVEGWRIDPAGVGGGFGGKPRLLDLFCGAGGATRGYMDAGFHVVGVDINPQPDYAGDEFIQGDAIAYLAAHGHEYDARHASPPCQASCMLTKGTNQGAEYLNLIPATRALLTLFEGPSVIENVQGSDLRRDLTLCGEMFGLGVIRHRYFELSGFPALPLAHKPHRGRVAGWRHGEWFDGPYFAVYGEGGGKGSVPQWQDAMGIHWTDNRKSIAEAIPPAYTRFIGGQLMGYLESQAAIAELVSS